MSFQNTGFFRETLECFIEAPGMLVTYSVPGTVGDTAVSNLNENPAVGMEQIEFCKNS